MMGKLGKNDGNIMGHHGINLLRLENMEQTAKKYGKNMGTWENNSETCGKNDQKIRTTIGASTRDVDA